MNPEKVWIVLNERDYTLGVFTSVSAAESQAAIFTSNNRRAGDENSNHRAIEYVLPGTETDV